MHKIDPKGSERKIVDMFLARYRISNIFGNIKKQKKNIGETLNTEYRGIKASQARVDVPTGSKKQCSCQRAYRGCCRRLPWATNGAIQGASQGAGTHRGGVFRQPAVVHMAQEALRRREHEAHHAKRVAGAATELAARVEELVDAQSLRGHARCGGEGDGCGQGLVGTHTSAQDCTSQVASAGVVS